MLTESERKRLFPEQDENGIDLSLLRANLRLTPTERYLQHQSALKMMLEVRRAGRALRSANTNKGA